jgi:RimJ/RimL family protein N-acetyltransferase
MQFLPLATLEGPRVCLLPLEEKHADAFLVAGRDPKIWTYFFAPIQSREDAERFIAGALEERNAGTSLPFAIEDKAANRIVGSTRLLDILPAHRQAELGATWLDSAMWRTAVNTECKYLLLSFCFEELNLIRVQLKTDARNERSQRAIERIGGVREGVLRAHRILPDGFVRDSVVYSITAPEWPGVKARLAAMLR